MTDEKRCEPPPELRDRDGWHWVQYKQSPMCRAEWSATEREWFFPEDQTHSPVESLSTSWRYLAPVASPAEVDALRLALANMERDMLHEHQDAVDQYARVLQVLAEAATLRATVVGLVEALEEVEAALTDMLENLPNGNWIADAAHETLTAAIARAKGDGV